MQRRENLFCFRARKSSESFASLIPKNKKETVKIECRLKLLSHYHMLK